MLSWRKTMTAKNAGALDKDLMSIGAFSLDQLMELAGLSVSQAGEPYLHGYFNLLNSNLVASLSRPSIEQGEKSSCSMWAWK
jgi:hypothetical protein